MEQPYDSSADCEACSHAPVTKKRAGDVGPDRGQLREGFFLGASVLVGVLAAILSAGPLGTGRIPEILFLFAYLLAGWKVLAGAARNLLKGRPFDELFLMTVATLGAFLIGHPEEALGVMVFYKIGEMFQDAAVLRSRRSIRAVLSLRPDVARAVRGGEEALVPPESVEVGETVLVRPGERVPLDGILESGEGFLDTSALTGESVPRRAVPGMEVLAGSIAHEGVLTVRVSRPASGSYAARIADLVENAAHAKSRSERFITRFARWYTPAVVAAASAIALLPPLLFPGQEFSVWTYRALVMLVISCPCALVISVPLGYFAGLGGAAHRGILVKGSQVFDVLAEARAVVFDKTGTLTRGNFEVKSIRPADGRSEADLLRLAARAESGSNHPIAAALRREAERRSGPEHDSGGGGNVLPEVLRREIAGRGIIAENGGNRVVAGSAALLLEEGIELSSSALAREPGGETEVYLAENGVYAGRIGLGDTVKPDAREALDRLRGLGVTRFALLSGDAREPTEALAAELDISEVHFGLLPHEKLERLEEVLAREAGGKGRTLFVGDGINDAPVLARADAGIAMGAGADAALETADAVLMSGSLVRLPEAVRRARNTRNIVRQNIALALGFKLIFLALGAAGEATMWEAVLADVGVTLLAVLNSVRSMK